MQPARARSDSASTPAADSTAIGAACCPAQSSSARSEGAGFGIIVDGQAAVSVRGQPIRVLGPGDYFGEMSLIDESARYRSAKITAETELHCLMFAKWNFRPFAMSHPQTVWALLEMMAQRVRDAENR